MNRHNICCHNFDKKTKQKLWKKVQTNKHPDTPSMYTLRLLIECNVCCLYCCYCCHVRKYQYQTLKQVQNEHEFIGIGRRTREPLNKSKRREFNREFHVVCTKIDTL